MTPVFPCFRPVGDRAVLAEFGDRIADETEARVARLDHLLASRGMPGFVEAVPAYVNLLVVFDPVVTDHATVADHLRKMIDLAPPRQQEGRTHDVLVCHDPDLSPDIGQVAAMTGQSTEAVIATHQSATYRVVMYGFAPGYAYLSGLPPALRLPRKPSAIRGVPAGSVLIAGGQCLVSTLPMPTGWWNIGRSPTRILLDDPDRPFLFDVGDTVRFRQIGRDSFEHLSRRG